MIIQHTCPAAASSGGFSGKFLGVYASQTFGDTKPGSHAVRGVAAEGALYELRMRLLADKVAELQRAAYGKELRDVEALIIARFADACQAASPCAMPLSDDEKSVLERCRQLRNKSSIVIFVRRDRS
jgi:hypothetical protein